MVAAEVGDRLELSVGVPLWHRRPLVDVGYGQEVVLDAALGLGIGEVLRIFQRVPAYCLLCLLDNLHLEWLDFVMSGRPICLLLQCDSCTAYLVCSLDFQGLSVELSLVSDLIEYVYIPGWLLGIGELEVEEQFICFGHWLALALE